MRYWLKFTFIILIFISCSQKDKERIIPKRDLVNLLVDMHIADALAMNQSINDQFKNLDSSMVYSSVLKKYGYTKNELINSLTYYSSKPDKLLLMYDEVFSELSKRVEYAKSINEKYSNTDNIWRSKPSRYVIVGKESNYPKPFEFPIDSAGIYVLNAYVKMNVEDSAVNPRIIAYFFSPENDVPEHRQYFEETPIRKSKFAREYIIVSECKDLSFTHMRIIIPEYDNSDSTFNKHTEISNLSVGKLRQEEDSE